MNQRITSKPHRIQQWIVGIYLVLALASMAVIPFADDPLGAIFLVLLAMPWTIPIGALLDSLALDSAPISTALLGLGVALNAWILWKVTVWLPQLWKRSR